ncbi:ATP-dependent DNA helicase mph1 [Rhynchospora pubera]|uniref:ATP-dependent DNA helicase mph1 n=1 Tax=Rhynchospora pubera TaxID=906938 RepID=A0AAV8EPE0_9POAL|nr:ATP-dependent DNA helicase mph1 [Rhynchospora pubera]
MEELQNEVKEALQVPVWDCGSHLYDSYELVSFSHFLDRHVMLLPFLKNAPKLPDCARFYETNEAMRNRRQKKKATVGRRIKKEMIKKIRSKVIMSCVVKAIACWSE